MVLSQRLRPRQPEDPDAGGDRRHRHRLAHRGLCLGGCGAADRRTDRPVVQPRLLAEAAAAAGDPAQRRRRQRVGHGRRLHLVRQPLRRAAVPDLHDAAATLADAVRRHLGAVFRDRQCLEAGAILPARPVRLVEPFDQSDAGAVRADRCASSASGWCGGYRRRRSTSSPTPCCCWSRRSSPSMGCGRSSRHSCVTGTSAGSSWNRLSSASGHRRPRQELRCIPRFPVENGRQRIGGAERHRQSRCRAALCRSGSCRGHENRR